LQIAVITIDGEHYDAGQRFLFRVTWPLTAAVSSLVRVVCAWTREAIPRSRIQARILRFEENIIEFAFRARLDRLNAARALRPSASMADRTRICQYHLR
jgi:hypothetical protein